MFLTRDGSSSSFSGGGSSRKLKKQKSQLRQYEADEVKILEEWSMLSQVFDDLDFDNSGTIGKQELLYAIRAFCKEHKIVYSKEVGQQIMGHVDDNGDGDFDKNGK